MKNNIVILLLALMLIPYSVNSQTQKGINYQAVARNSSGDLLENKPIGVRFSLIKGPLPGSNLYVETQALSTNQFGLFTAIIGRGQINYGDFITVDWKTGDIFLKVEIDPAGGTNFTEVSNSLLQSVPYSFIAEKSKYAESLSPNATGIVKSINDTEGAITLEGGGGTTINKSGQKITISSTGGSGSGIQGVQNTDNNLTITNPNGPMASINFSQTATAIPKGTAGGDLTGTYPDPVIGDGKVTTIKMADGAVITSKLEDNSVTDAKIKDVDWSKIKNVPPLGGAKNIDDLTDAKADASSVFLGLNSGNSDNGGNKNTAVGINTLKSNTSGYSNVAVGIGSLYSNTIRSNLVAIGDSALYNNISGNGNTAVGSKTLYSNTSGALNIAIGEKALNGNISGSLNTAIGVNALLNNKTGSHNTAVGSAALNSNELGDENTAVGAYAIQSGTSGGANTALGFKALYMNQSGHCNTSLGSYNLIYNSSGSHNTAIGYRSLVSNTTGYSNTAIGSDALSDFSTGHRNTAIGDSANVTMNNLTNITALGYNTKATASNQVRIGNSAVTSIGGYVNWTNLSDGRFKCELKEDVIGLNFIMKLKPLTYQLNLDNIATCNKEGINSDESYLKCRQEKSKIRYSGFIAQDVELAAISVGYDFSGVDIPKNENDFYGLRYAEFVVPLIKAVQEQQEIILKQQKELVEQKKINDQQNQELSQQKILNENLLKRIEKLENQFSLK